MQNGKLLLPPPTIWHRVSIPRAHEAEKSDKRVGKKKKPKKKERLEEEGEEEAGEEVEGGWEKVKGGVPLVKVNALPG